MCAEIIRSDARKCRHCGEYFTSPLISRVVQNADLIHVNQKMLEPLKLDAPQETDAGDPEFITSEEKPPPIIKRPLIAIILMIVLIWVLFSMNIITIRGS